MYVSQERGLNREGAAVEDLDEPFFDENLGVPADVIIDGQKDFRLMDGFSFVFVTVKEILDDAGVVSPAGLVLSEVAEARSVFPGADRCHGFHVARKLLIGI